MLRHLRLGSPFAEVLMLVVALSSLGGYICWNLYYRYTQIEMRQQERIENATKIIAVNLEFELIAIDNILTAVSRDFLEPGVHEGSGEKFNRRLKDFDDAMPSIRALFVLNAEGTIVASDVVESIGQNFSEREYYQAPRSNPDPAIVYVSSPYKTRRGDTNITLTRVMLDANGVLIGIVGAALDPSYFKTLMDSVRYAPDVWTSLVHGDGKLFLTIPERKGLVGMDLNVPGSMFSRHKESGKSTTVFAGLIYSTGEDRMIAQRTFRPAKVILDKPLVIAASTDLKAHISGLRNDIYTQIGLFGLLVLTSSVGLLVHQRQERRASEALATHHTAQLRIAEQYRTVVHSSLDGFLITDHAARIIDANESAARMLGYSREELLCLNIADIEADETSEDTAAHIREMMERGHVQFETRHRRKDGVIINVEVSVLYMSELGEQFFAFVRDVTDRRRHQERLEWAAHYDALTGIPNRHLLADRLGQAIAQTKRNGTLLLVGYLDLDGFKPINDTYGHEAGDSVLLEISARLRSCLRGGDTVARVGGGYEFVFLIVGVDQFEDYGMALQRIVAAVAQPVIVGGRSVSISASVGVSVYPSDDVDAETLLRHADQAMYQAKQSGKNRFHLFTREG